MLDKQCTTWYDYCVQHLKAVLRNHVKHRVYTMTIENLVFLTRFSVEKEVHRNLLSIAVEDCDMEDGFFMRKPLGRAFVRKIRVRAPEAKAMCVINARRAAFCAAADKTGP